jgi:hypothetical protein
LEVIEFADKKYPAAPQVHPVVEVRELGGWGRVLKIGTIVELHLGANGQRSTIIRRSDCRPPLRHTDDGPRGGGRRSGSGRLGLCCSLRRLRLGGSRLLRVLLRPIGCFPRLAKLVLCALRLGARLAGLRLGLPKLTLELLQFSLQSVNLSLDRFDSVVRSTLRGSRGRHDACADRNQHAGFAAAARFAARVPYLLDLIAYRGRCLRRG